MNDEVDGNKTRLIEKFAKIFASLNESQEERFKKKQSQLAEAFANSGVEISPEEKLRANIAAAESIIEKDKQDARDRDDGLGAYAMM